MYLVEWDTNYKVPPQTWQTATVLYYTDGGNEKMTAFDKMLDSTKSKAKKSDLYFVDEPYDPDFEEIMRPYLEEKEKKEKDVAFKKSVDILEKKNPFE